MSEIRFSDGLPERPVIAGTDKTPDELVGKVCGRCIRCAERDRPGETGWHCWRKSYWHDISPDDKACDEYWDKDEQNELDRLRDDEQENRRKSLMGEAVGSGVMAQEAWEAIRKLTCAVCGVRKVRELKTVEESPVVAEKICQYIYDMAMEFKEEKKDGKEI